MSSSRAWSWAPLLTPNPHYLVRIWGPLQSIRRGARCETGGKLIIRASILYVYVCVTVIRSILVIAYWHS